MVKDHLACPLSGVFVLLNLPHPHQSYLNRLVAAAKRKVLV